MFLRAADIVERRRDEIIALLATETGAAGGFAGFQVLTSVRLLRQAANWGYLPVGEVIRSDNPGTFALALRKPLGVVAGISPWNGAHVLAWRTVVNPLAFGNTVVLKPSEEAPVSAGLLVAEIIAEAGFPPGVVNVITHAPGEAVPVADEFFIDRLLTRTRSLPTGDPAAPGTIIGPLITSAAPSQWPTSQKPSGSPPGTAPATTRSDRLRPASHPGGQARAHAPASRTPAGTAPPRSARSCRSWPGPGSSR
jgi:acyl-CoA reductase-like NAD-dependent aldehyde dehydrogenase